MNDNNWDGFWVVRANWLIKAFYTFVHNPNEYPTFNNFNNRFKSSYFYQKTQELNTETSLECAMRLFSLNLDRITKELPKDGETLLQAFKKEFLTYLESHHIQSEKHLFTYISKNNVAIADLLLMLYQFEYTYISTTHREHIHSKEFLISIQNLYYDTHTLVTPATHHTSTEDTSAIYFKEIIHRSISHLEQSMIQARLFEIEDYKFKLAQLDTISQILPELDAKLATAENLMKQTETHIDNLGVLKNDYNIIVLKSGFDHIKKVKEQEKKKLQIRYYILIACIISVLLVPAQSMNHWYGITDDVNSWLIFMPHIIKLAIEIFLIYLFRLNYLEYKSILAQILQIDLRSSLCQFIVNYLNQTENIKGSHALEMFEKLIFSNLQINEEQIPSALDGLDQFTNLFKSFKGN